MSKQFFTAFFMLAFISFFVEATPPSPPNPPSAPNTIISSPENNPSGYEALSDPMKVFADQLNPSNKVLFCNVFNDMQRQNAMQLNGTHEGTGATYTPDTAVEQVAKANNLLPSSMQTGACHIH